ncbi:ead/Ea22-like family protein, partial [Salmonella enterica]
QALREIAAAAVGAHERLSVMPPDDIFDISLAEGTQLDADITALNALNSAANPTTVLALLDELEAAEKRIAELDKRLIEYAGIATREAHRVAELEARTVILPEPIIVLHRRDFTDAHREIYAYPEAEVNAALADAVIGVNGE